MECYIKISFLNDFIFCPISIYYHELYGNLKEELYYDTAQLEGKKVHEKIDEKQYSTHKNILQGLDVFCTKYNLAGKIDIFDTQTGLLTERKKHISKIYSGYIFQLYAQYFALKEMGFDVKQARLYSSDDNKVYPVVLPFEKGNMLKEFENLIKQMQDFDIQNFTPFSKQKCQNCIYSNFCDRTLA